MATEPHLIFMCGSSQVGKTTTFNRIQESHADKVRCVNMAARDVRQKLGNPSWGKLTGNVEVCGKHQRAIMEVYRSRIAEECMKVSLNPELMGTPLLFERCPIDVLGYTDAYLTEAGQVQNKNAWLSQQMDNMLYDIGKATRAISAYVTVILHTVSHDYPYNTENGARPPAEIRTHVDYYLQAYAENLAMYNFGKATTTFINTAGLTQEAIDNLYATLIGE